MRQGVFLPVTSAERQNMILNLEINEIPKVVIEDFIKERPGSCLARLQQKNDLILAETVVTDIPEEMLYPSPKFHWERLSLV